jgi:hypothetical protein
VHRGTAIVMTTPNQSQQPVESGAFWRIDERRTGNWYSVKACYPPNKIVAKRILDALRLELPKSELRLVRVETKVFLEE